MSEKRQTILNWLAAGEITSEEAERLLQTAAPTAGEQAGRLVQSLSSGMKKGAHFVAQTVAQHTGAEEKERRPKPVPTLPQTPWSADELMPIVKTHARNAAMTAAASGLLPGAGPTVAAMTSAGFVLSILHQVNESLGVKLTKTEMKPVADAIVHTITPMAMAKYFAASGLSFIPIVGNIAAGALMTSVCHSIVYASGVVYMETLRKLSDAGERVITADMLRATADDVIQHRDMTRIFEDAKATYEADYPADDASEEQDTKGEHP